MAPRIRVYHDPDAVAAAAAEEIATRIDDGVAQRGWVTLVLSGGSTPVLLFEQLANPPYRYRIPWTDVHVFWGDERAVPPEHEDSNFGTADRILLSRIPIPSANVHRMLGEGNPDVAATEYEEEIRAVLGLEPGALPVFDLVLLGVGSDGHTASLFPESVAWEERKRLVTAVWVESLKAHRITLTPPVFREARTVLFMATGASKAPVVARVLESSEGDVDLPAARIEPRTGDLLWFLDQQAAQRLTRYQHRS